MECVCLKLLVPILLIPVVYILYSQRRYKARRKNFRSKVVVVTGASSGLGEALARLFFSFGCHVIICSRQKDKLDELRTNLMKNSLGNDHGKVMVVPLDLSDVHSLQAKVEEILQLFGYVDILINNGGVSQRGTILSTSQSVEMEIMLVNYFGTVALTKALLPSMILRGEGHIVFISSIQGLIALPERSTYGASKHAIQAFSDSLRTEIADKNVQVTTISAGYIQTNLSRNALLGSGEKYNKMDDATQNGYTVDYAAEQILKAIVLQKKEILLCTILPKMMVYVRRLLPSLYFYLIQKRYSFKKEN